jgi:hypothetical protein
MGISEGQWRTLIDLLWYTLDAIMLAAIGYGFQVALLSFMVADASFVWWLVAIGILAMIGTLACTWILSEFLCDQIGESAALILWLALAVMVFDAFTRRGKASFIEDCNQKASDLFMFAHERLGYSSGIKIGVSFGKLTYFFVAAVIAVSVLRMIHYWNLAGG